MKMMEIRYSAKEDIDITGTSIEFQKLHHVLLSLIDGKKRFLYVETSTGFDPAPYDSCLKGIEFRRNDTNKIFSNGTYLVIQGTNEFLENLALNLPRDKEAESSCTSCHIHYDWISFGQYLPEGSTGLILTLIY